MTTEKELRIGNWIRGASRGLPVMVTGRMIAQLEDGILGVQPIELTTEILESCGFEKMVNMLQLNKDWFMCKSEGSFYLQVEKDADLMFVCERLNLSHVNFLHQLQNLYFALTGEELEVDSNGI